MESSVVLIESDLILMRTLTRGLERSGYQVTTWTDIHAAIEALSTTQLRTTTPLIVDLNSTRSWDVRLITRLEARYKHNRVILLDDWLIDLDKFPERWSFLRKPFGITELLDELEALEALPFSGALGDSSSDELSTR